MSSLALPVGSLANVAAILIGSLLGILLHNRLTKELRTIVFQGLGLCVLVLGISMALKFTNPLLPIFSVVFGGIIGEIIDLEGCFEKMAAWCKAKVRSKSDTFVDGMVTATLIFCVGAMAMLGSFDEGLRHDPTILLTKSLLDGFAAIALAATYGVGVAFSVVPLFIYQYGLTLGAASLQGVLTDTMITQLTATGGILILGIGVNLLELKRVKVSNMLPALVIIVVLTALFG
ncbi:MAG: DUF554 domain-containing protein [Desulfovibrionaceae bacterium]